jgi:tetratricopeptide (TPR) repeat protein
MNVKNPQELAKEIDKNLSANDLLSAMINAEALILINKSAGLAYKGVIELRQGNYDAAESALLESYQLNNRQNLALANLIPLYLRKKDYKKALAYGEQAYKHLRDNQSVAVNYSAALLQEQKAEQAIEILLPFLDANKPNISVLTGLISAYRSLFMRDEADNLLKLAEDHFGDRHEVIRLKADTLSERSPEEALKSFKLALEIDPYNVATRWNMSLVQLRLGEFEEGWINYDNGLLPEVGKIGRPLPKLFEGLKRIIHKSELNPEKWTIVVAEQGIGDQVLFLGVMQEFLSEYPKSIYITEKRMQSIVKRSFDKLNVYPYGLGGLLQGNKTLINGILPIGSIQKFYRSNSESFERRKNVYLEPNNEKTKRYREILLERARGRKIVGISWKGGYWERAQRTKTIELEHWSKLLEKKDCLYVPLQYGDVTADKKYTEGSDNLIWIEGIDFKKDLDSWLSLACACDHIVSVSTALVHFAGAAGMNISLLLSDKGAPFIWGLDQQTSIAYKNIKIYRQKKGEVISDFFDRLATTELVDVLRRN